VFCDFRCHIPECDAEDAIYKPEWLLNAVPYKDGKPSPCERYQPWDNSTSADGSPANNKNACSPDIFDSNSVVKCRQWVFDTEELTIANEASLYLYSPLFILHEFRWNTPCRQNILKHSACKTEPG